ncbi:MAG TPA: hypothetical protein VHC22_31675 [Pirellulales bacterium]|nr:hypothetical protein [Pirellulales bacterium]
MWLVAEVERLKKVERLRVRRLFQFSLRRMLIVVALVGIAITAWNLLPPALHRLAQFLFPNGIG